MSPQHRRRTKQVCPLCDKPWDNATLTLKCGCTITAHVEPASARAMRRNPRRLTELEVPCGSHGDGQGVFSYQLRTGAAQ